MHPALAGGAVLLQLVVGSRTPRQSDDFLFDEIAQRWLKRNAIENPLGWPELLEKRFAHLALGVFSLLHGARDAM